MFDMYMQFKEMPTLEHAICNTLRDTGKRVFCQYIIEKYDLCSYTISNIHNFFNACAPPCCRSARAKNIALNRIKTRRKDERFSIARYDELARHIQVVTRLQVTVI